MISIQNTHKAFSIIEVMVGIFIFSLGLVSIYALLASSLSASSYSENAIVASNLSREQIELFKNIRDTNYKKLNVWNKVNPYTDFQIDNEVFELGKYYTLENNFGNSDSSIDVGEITGFKQGEDELLSMKKYQLCLDENEVYTYDCDSNNTQTVYYRYLYLEELRDEDNTVITDAVKVTSKVIWTKRGYHEFYIDTIITDWRRI
ncbi:prepilin-type N-terminal cleavage/methylation domain-containing protein [Candidatus Gracilibacteria bacterium]|nr:prepilin-type N-terminal cleavage/methylation domain-containing protein [Candidatus Gracilibacteria bacterium]